MVFAFQIIGSVATRKLRTDASRSTMFGESFIGCGPIKHEVASSDLLGSPFILIHFLFGLILMYSGHFFSINSRFIISLAFEKSCIENNRPIGAKLLEPVRNYSLPPNSEINVLLVYLRTPLIAQTVKRTMVG